MSEPFCNDGCDLSREEVLARLKIGLKTDEELHPDFPYVRNPNLPVPVLAGLTPDIVRDGEAIAARESTKQCGIRAADYDKASAPSLSITDSCGGQFISPTDRGLLLLALPSKRETET